MKKTSNNMHLNLSRNLAIVGLLGTVAVPAVGTATTPDGLEPAPIAVDADPDCEQSTVKLEVDVATGNVYLVDPATGNLQLTDNDLNVYFGSLGHVLVMIHYNTGDWAVTITPDGDPPVTYRTTGGWLRYSITEDFAQYDFASMSMSPASASAMMTPVVPDIVLRPKKTCPPST